MLRMEDETHWGIIDRVGFDGKWSTLVHAHNVNENYVL